ncbi:MAG: tRNA (N(6)-L-threonylcarbamoyladenosine(37)-C(2))-methylthiotransferase MtaB, partial [Salibacteraceae bacterium]|nr:tRNA (N(6)-L-threonylcarbamoyladenosine(37)-C(2))-methylthiotransferase MtaB [Salibacteraceae bacterium]MDP4843220.1 tRNA (N(6)-L-threonylcarbamoyladenosine(37)-C(2))-methylthiotransferase MtaB [Salibacteraceae bacterium]
MNPYKTVAFYTLGCKLNFSETSTIARLFEQGGYAKVDFDDRPDIYIINTCSVTDHADKKCRNLVRRAKSKNPDAFIAVVGCYAQLKPEEIANIEGVNVVLGANEKFNILAYLDKQPENGKAHIENGHIKEVKEFIPSYSANDRTRTFLKVQDGCDYFCSFCTIPLARGRSRNQTVAETVKVAQEVAETGVKEVVLTGVNIGDFGQGKSESFLELITALDEVAGIDRFRISSIEPNLLNDEIIDFVSTSKRFVPHFHIPLQSGSDAMLQNMRRRYLTPLYRERIERIKAKMPNACIGVDVIVGFPGETDEEFMKTVEFIKSLDVSYLHVFTYSERANTTALRIDEVIPMQVRQERNKTLTNLSLKKKRAFYETQVGSTHPVLWEAAD